MLVTNTTVQFGVSKIVNCFGNIMLTKWHLFVQKTNQQQYCEIIFQINCLYFILYNVVFSCDSKADFQQRPLLPKIILNSDFV